MREKKFSKGSWAIHEETAPTGTWLWLIAGVKRVCRVVIYSGEDVEQRANAHLIAAAPELLEALEYVVEYLNGEGEPNEIGLALLSAESVIRKAYGETP